MTHIRFPRWFQIQCNPSKAFSASWPGAKTLAAWWSPAFQDLQAKPLKLLDHHLAMWPHTSMHPCSLPEETNNFKINISFSCHPCLPEFDTAIIPWAGYDCASHVPAHLTQVIYQPGNFSFWRRWFTIVCDPGPGVNKCLYAHCSGCYNQQIILAMNRK